MTESWIGVITGDIIHSRKLSVLTNWQQTVKSTLQKVNAANEWSIFRGDAFQVSVKAPTSLRDAIYIKACLRAEGADARIAIGIGEAGEKKKAVNESIGEAFILSGSRLETLKKDRLNLAVNTPSTEFNSEINIMLRLALVIMDNWSKTSATMIKVALEQKDMLQNELALKLGKSQSSVSETLKRARFSEIMSLNGLFQKKLINLAK